MADGFSHNYIAYPVGTKVPKISNHEEQLTTFSALVTPSSLLNLLILNFGYHNAHHLKTTIPWHSLPKLDKSMLTGDKHNVYKIRHLPYWEVVKNFHKYVLTLAIVVD